MDEELKQLKKKVSYIEKTLRLFSYAAFGEAIAILLLGINLLRIVFQW